DFRKEYRVKHGKNLPPLFPNGWLPLIESSCVIKSKIVNVKFCGFEVIVFRSNSGEVYVLDAYCPHLGANLGSGGSLTNHCNKVCVRCPFHGWQFRATDGVCVKVPYTQKQCAPNGVRIKTWLTDEVNGFIYVWYHAEGLEPTYNLPKFNELNSRWWYAGRNEHLFNAVYQDVPENAADMSHFAQLHPSSMFLGSDLDVLNKFKSLTSIMSHKFEAKWSVGEAPDTHKSILKLLVRTCFFNYSFFDITLNIEQVGPSVVNLHFKSFAGIEGVLIQNFIPVAPLQQRLIHHIYVNKGLLGKIVAKIILRGETIQVERDIRIWRDKKYISNPKFVKEDSCLVKHRKWFSQFYSENSKTLNLLDW
ncbi:Rieske domain-containing protein-like protein, partial [Leptotrombidium deliense]